MRWSDCRRQRGIHITRGFGQHTEQEVADSVIEAIDAIGRGEFTDLPPLGDSQRFIRSSSPPSSGRPQVDVRELVASIWREP